MVAEDGLKAQKRLAQGSALGNVGKNKVALKGLKLLAQGSALGFRIDTTKSP